MAHEVQTMAYANDMPWHGLGNKLSPDQSIEVWQREAGMDWSIKEAEVMYSVSGGEGLHLKANSDSKVLFRSDTHAPLSVVSKRYKTVQPADVLEFYRDLVSVGGFELESAGVLKGGKKLWALAKTGQEVILRGGDRVNGYLLLATSCDGTLATVAQFTSVRVVCNNTLQLAIADSCGAIKVPHSTKFDPVGAKQRLGIGLSAWSKFEDDMQLFVDRPINKFEALSYFVNVLGESALQHQQFSQKTVKTLQHLYLGGAKGSDLASASGTLFGALNAVTDFVDHSRRARNDDYRLDSALFGQGAVIKARAYREALKLVA